MGKFVAWQLEIGNLRRGNICGWTFRKGKCTKNPTESSLSVSMPKPRSLPLILIILVNQTTSIWTMVNKIQKPTCNNLFNKAASTPSLKIVHSTINEYLPYYSSVHRGSGFKSQLSTHIFEEARTGVMKFVNANENQHICIFTKNTSESINKLAKRFPYTEARDVVLTTVMEHHSNDLPWRYFSPKTVHVKSLPDGRLDMQDLKEKLKFYNNRIALVSVTAASNVTGVLNPIHDIAELVSIP